MTVKDCNGERFDVSELILSLDNDVLRLSSGKESDLEGVEVHGCLSAPSDILVSEIRGAGRPTIYSAQCMLVTALMTAMMMLLQGLLQAENMCSSSAKPYLGPISLADDNDTAAPPKSCNLLCVCVGGLWPYRLGICNE